MNEKLKNLITVDNILSYTDACVKLNEILIDKKDEFDLLIIPSRGAYPFYLYAQYSSYLIGNRFEAFTLNSHYKVWLLPYTADWGSANIKANSKNIRYFWTKVLYDSLKKKSSPYTEFYQSLLNNLSDKLTFNASNCNLDIENKKEKFIFIDTAISGKAICDIINAFDNMNIKNYAYPLDCLKRHLTLIDN